MNFFQRRKILKSTNAYDLIPIRRCEHQLEEDGKITILVPKFKNPRVAKFMLSARRGKYISIHLDETGSIVWLAIDGIQTIKSISEKLQEQFGETFQQAGTRVNKFMSRLYEERYITFKQLEDAAK
jgi:hypothetical protein